MCYFEQNYCLKVSIVFRAKLAWIYGKKTKTKLQAIKNNIFYLPILKDIFRDMETVSTPW